MYGGWMFCPNCGAESTFGLNYCKLCGGSLSDASPPAATPGKNVLAALILAAATVGIVLGGIAIVFNFALSLIGPQPPGFTPPNHDAGPVAGMMVVFGSAAIILTTFMLIRLFARVMGFGSPSNKPARRAHAFPTSPNVAQIPAPPMAVHSVTEHTTRNFEPRVYQRDTSD